MSTDPRTGIRPESIRPDEMARHAADAARFLKALANENRLMILCNLVAGEHSVGELLARLPLSQSALSQHLAVLREDGLVTTRRQAQAVYYALAGDRAARVMAVLYDIYCAPATAEGRH